MIKSCPVFIVGTVLLVLCASNIAFAQVGPVVPFIEGSVGLYRASFDPSRGSRPDFYQRRMAANLPDRRRITFMDPSFTLGEGVNLFITRHVSIRPDVEAKIVRRDAHGHVVTALSVHLAYHFENHPITPLRSRERS